MIKRANLFVEENKAKVNSEYRQKYHFMPPIGWMNDPNGFSRFQDLYHLFYQYNPYKAKPDLIHWGHATTKDFVTWELEEVALAPDQAYDSDGCFSGTAMEDEGKLYLMYTSVHKEGQQTIQEQALAFSDDGIHFNKCASNPVISTEDLPEGINPSDFRDPKIWKDSNGFNCIVMAKDEKLGGRMLLFQSLDLEHWDYKSDFIQADPELGVMWECPDIFRLQDKEVVLMSVIDLPEKDYKYWNKQSAVYGFGTINGNGEMLLDNPFEEIDYGFDLYAPQTLEMKDGRRIMIAWMQAWEDSIPTQELGHGWAGTMTLPRELSINKGLLIQKPVKEIENYRNELVCYEDIVVSDETITLDGICGNSVEIEMEVDMKDAESFTVNMFETQSNKVTLTYQKDNEELTFDRTNSGLEITSKDYEKPNYRTAQLKLINGKLKLRIFIDTSSVEIFAQDGLMTITSRIYPIDKEYGISFNSKGTAYINKINKWYLA